MPQKNAGQTAQEPQHPKNEVKLEGNVGKDPRQQTFPDGGRAVNFSVAIDHSYIDKNGKARKYLLAEYFRVSEGCRGRKLHSAENRRPRAGFRPARNR